MKIILLFLTLVFLAPLHSDYCWPGPWGKDSCLACPPKRVCKCARTPLAKIGAACIRFHQVVISPIDGPRSHFRPTSSQYALDAMRKYGFFTGVAMGCERLLRENKEEWVYPTVEVECKAVKWDPIDGCPPPPPDKVPGKG